MIQRFAALLATVISVLALQCAASAAETASNSYAQFTAGANAQHGLFTLLRKDGQVYFDITSDQLDKDYLETIVPGNGIGGDFIVWGNTDHLPAELVRFERAGDGIALVWPNWYFRGDVGKNFPQSVTGIGKIVAEGSGHIVFAASPLFSDALDMSHIINGSLNTNGSNGYHLDQSRTYFGETKSFPENVVIDVNQLWSSDVSHVAPDTAPDSRSMQMQVVYNFARLPSDNYVPRYADDRVGIYDDIYVDFSPSTDMAHDRRLRYVIRWNFAPEDPARPSRAMHPMVFYESNTIPQRFRKPIADAVLKWNLAFEKIGIRDAIQVKDQPSDPGWDADDIRYNVLRWTAEQRPSFGADSQTLFDPRTGEEFRTGILISSDVPRRTADEWRQVVDPVRYGRNTDPVPEKFIDDNWLAVIMHETGHNLGMQHNFIGSMAYSARQLQDPAFTAAHGIASTVMEYAPINIWPHPYGQGSYWQTALGPYDYYAMKFAYAHIPGANTPEQELPTLRKWAEAWSNPSYRYASDEDVSWNDGHAADPRSEQGDLTNDPIAWTKVQLDMQRRLMDWDTNHFPYAGEAYERASDAFAGSLRSYLGDVTSLSHYIGGLYVSRAHRGDPGAEPPVVAVPIATQMAALNLIGDYLFSDKHLSFAPSTLTKLGYSEWAGYGYVGWEGYGNLPVWAYDPPARHDYPVVDAIGNAQNRVLTFVFMPQVLARIEQNPLQSRGRTLTMSELFTWMQQNVYREIGRGSISLLRRNLQSLYTDKLIALANAPAKGTPASATALARLELTRLHESAAAAYHAGRGDVDTQAHLLSLVHKTESALKP